MLKSPTVTPGLFDVGAAAPLARARHARHRNVQRRNVAEVEAARTAGGQVNVAGTPRWSTS
jgi:hypothetical protein